MYNMTEDSDNYSKTSGSLWLFCRDKQSLNDDDDSIVDFVILLIHLNLKKK